MRTAHAAMLALVTLTLTGCLGAPAPVTSSGCAWVTAHYPPDRERPVLVRDAPVTARWLAGHNSAVETACPPRS